MIGTLEWATYPRLLEHSYFEWTRKLREMEERLHTPIPDSLHWTRRFEYPWILYNLFRNEPAHRTLIDVGSGATALQFLISVQQPGWGVTSIDPDLAAVAWINSRGHPQNPVSRLGGFPVLPFNCDRFDIGICISVLEHLPKEQVLPSIRELLRVSRKEVLITMDVALGKKHPTQVDYSDLQQICTTLDLEVPERDRSITFQMNDYMFGVACLHLAK
jgi:hypothetical protein